MLSLSDYSDCAAKRHIAAERLQSTRIEWRLVVRSIPKAAQRPMAVRSIPKDNGEWRRGAAERQRPRVARGRALPRSGTLPRRF